MPIADILRIHWAYEESRILHAAVDLAIFDAIPAKGATPADIAKARHLDERATSLLLNALTGLGLLRKRASHFFLTNDARRFLVSSSPQFFGHMVRHDSGNWDVWGRLHDALRSGKTARPADMYQSEPEGLRRFIYGMHSIAMARGDASVLPQRVDLSRATTLLDVGGGPGTYAVEFLKRFKRLHATVFDLPATLALTKEIVDKSGVADRVRLVAGDYNRDVLPGGFDAVLLFNIVHSEGEAAVQGLFRKCFAAMSPGGTFILKDHVMDATRTRPRDGAVFSVVMALFTGGRCYGFDEMRAWLGQAGFTNVREVLPKAPLTQTLVIARKPGP